MSIQHILVGLVVPSGSFRRWGRPISTHLCHFYSFLSISRRRFGAVLYTRGIFAIDFLPSIYMCTEEGRTYVSLSLLCILSVSIGVRKQGVTALDEDALDRQEVSL